MLDNLHDNIILILKQDNTLCNKVHSFLDKYDQDVLLPSVVVNIKSMEELNCPVPTYNVYLSLQIFDEEKRNLYQISDILKQIICDKNFVLSEYRILGISCNSVEVHQSPNVLHIRCDMNYKMLIQNIVE